MTAETACSHDMLGRVYDMYADVYLWRCEVCFEFFPLHYFDGSQEAT